jgi:hypothetical protein
MILTTQKLNRTYEIYYNTVYLFDSEVFLEPHYLRFRPKQTPYLDVTDFSITIRQNQQDIK